MGSKILDISLAVFMGYFAYSKFSNGEMGFAIFFSILFVMNVVSAVVKHLKGVKVNDVQKQTLK